MGQPRAKSFMWKKSWSILWCKGSRKKNFPCLGAETPVWQGARTAHTPRSLSEISDRHEEVLV